MTPFDPTARPAEPFADAKRRLAGAVQDARAEILELSHRIHVHPERAFEEPQAAGWVAEAVTRHGFEVEHPAGSLSTAVRGRLRGRRAGSLEGSDGTGPRIGILAEYDALPGLGHGCGHNTMAASGVGAAIALASVADELAGEIVFLGCPAEEFGSGKQVMLDDGLFEGIDAALLFHPGDRTEVGCELLASEDVEVTFRGLQAHAASEPWAGRNALDALVLLFSSIGLWRQQLPQHARVHGIVLEGGTAANIIPDRAVARFMIRSAEQEYFGQMHERFRNLVTAAALATDTQGETVFSLDSFRAKSGIGRPAATSRPAASPPSFAVIPRDKAIELTSRLSAEGRLDWEVPAGQWTVMRFGSTPTGRENWPARTEGRGLECDKLSKEAVAAHFTNFVSALIEDAGPAAGERVLRSVRRAPLDVGCEPAAPPETSLVRASGHVAACAPTIGRSGRSSPGGPLRARAPPAVPAAQWAQP